jgi:hypothetical protein
MTSGLDGGLASARELFARTAVKDGRTVVTLHGFESGGAFVIEVEVFPITGIGLDPVGMGPYRFPTLDDAVGFVEEALLALEHLGCTIHSGIDDGRAAHSAAAVS